MDEALYQQWIDEQIENLTEAVIAHGIIGLLADFEYWLKNKAYIKKDHNK